MEVKDYYKNIPEDSLDYFNKLKDIAVSLLDNPEEKISYGIPHLIHKGKKIVAIAGFKKHVSLFPLGGRQIKKFEKELRDYKTSPGTIQFQLNQDLPINLIKDIVQDRLDEISS